VCDDIITLVWQTEDGEEKTEVMASVESVSQSEFFAAAQTGFKAQYKVSFWENDYDGQPLVEVGNGRYTVYRTYSRNDQKIELYLTDKAGV
jgi:hypothetical protein